MDIIDKVMKAMTKKTEQPRVVEDDDWDEGGELIADDYLREHVDKVRDSQSISKYQADLSSIDRFKKMFSETKVIEFDEKGHTITDNIYKESELKDIMQDANEQVELSKKGKNDEAEDRGMIMITQEDDRVIGIPHVQTQAGDSIYIINGRVMTGWSMYFSLTCIKSPEDYPKYVDYAFNVPYIWASLMKQARLSLGAGMDLACGNEDVEEPEEKFAKWLMFDRLNLNSSLRRKTAFHKKLYGNCYWHIKWGEDGFPEKITVLQPERMKIFLDPITTKVLFYVYLPPIIGGTVLTPYWEEKPNPNVVRNLALTYPRPIIIPPEDIIHFTQNKFTEYPFGFSSLKPLMDVASAKWDLNILMPILFKHYVKPIVHWMLDDEKLSRKDITARITAMKNQIKNAEPTTDFITTKKWQATVIQAGQGLQALLALNDDLDTQLFGGIGTPMTYFKPQGITDRMGVNQDKWFEGESMDEREEFEELVMRRILEPALEKKFGEKHKEVEFKWKPSYKKDETQDLSNILAISDRGLIEPNQALKMIGDVLGVKLEKDEGEEVDEILERFKEHGLAPESASQEGVEYGGMGYQESKKRDSEKGV